MSPIKPAHGVWLYSPSFSAAVVVTFLYAIVTAIQCFFTVFKYRAWYFIYLLIGALLETIGYGTRIASTKNRSSVGAYAIQSTLIVVAPLFVAASDYLLLSRLIRAVLPKSERRIAGIKPSWLTSMFVGCDIVTFLIQATGAAIVASGINNGTSVEGGTNILICGLCIQIATFGAFIFIALRFHKRALVQGRPENRAIWMKVLVAIYVSASFVMIRTIYRLIEFILGVNGYPFRHEWIFYVFESFPMLPAIGIFCVIYPASYLARLSNSVVSNEVQLPGRA